MHNARLPRSLRSTGVVPLVVLSLAPMAYLRQSAAQVQHYTQTNLVSATSGAAKVTDPHLSNPWGLSRASNGEWWVSDNGTGVATLYNGAGSIVSLVVTIPPGSASTKTGSPTGTVFYGGTDFQITPGNPAAFMFVTSDGTISGWNPSVNPTNAVIKVNTNGQSVFQGATMANVGSATFLYVADLRNARVSVYDTNFQFNASMSSAFKDPNLPPGYAPFNVQNIGGNIYVAFAEQNSAKNFVNFGSGLGFVDVFSSQGGLIRRLQHGSWLNAPWGLTQAPADFGIFSHCILVGQFGSGQIIAYDAATGGVKGTLVLPNGSAITIFGLWALSFGNSTTAGGPGNSLYFSAAQDVGLFGAIDAVENIFGNGQ